MDLLSIITILIIITASFSYFNEKFIKLPGTIGVVAISVVVSVLILVVGKTEHGITHTITTLATSIDFSKVLLDVMLGFLLFAGALHFDYEQLKKQRLAVFLLSTIGVIISTAVFGILLFLVTQWLNISIPLIYCFTFGALISPTDPIAVASILKTSTIPRRLNTIIAGESLFNDAVGLLLFVTLSGLAAQSGSHFSLNGLLLLFMQEVLGGIAIGLLMGLIGYKMISSITNMQNIFLISVALVFGISFLAVKLHASIPLGTVTAGLIIGNRSFSKHKPSYDFLTRIWQLLDEVLNTILFVMIGLQLVIMPFLNKHWLTGTISIFILLIARAISILLNAFVYVPKVEPRNLFILTWAGLRGGISIAMALSLPFSPYREIIVSSCYFIVIFSIIVQGLSLNRFLKRFSAKDPGYGE